MSRILLVDDEPRFCEATRELLQRSGHDVTTANGIAGARELLQRDQPEIVLLDLLLPDGNGLELLGELGEKRPKHVVIVTGHPGIKAHVRSLAGPGVSYLTKPLNGREILRAIDELYEAAPRLSGPDPRHFGTMVGESGTMQKVYEAIDRFGPTDTNVLIEGASGTGKELVAEALHNKSGRPGAFVPVNCGGLTKELVASELFGHEKGSFTGANRRHAGYFERAHQGTLFLDEITEMPYELQSHLLRALETNQIIRVGGESHTEIDVRLIAATNESLATAVEQKKLREDLYYRLAEFVIRLPPLRDRSADVATLAKHFVDELNAEYGTAKTLSSGAIERFEAYTWPGNVRELQHVVHRAYVLAQGEKAEIEAPSRFENVLGEAPRESGLHPGRQIREVERELIMRTLEHFDGDKRVAAETLGISLKTLYNRLNAYDEPERDKD